jgi:hypothetical protein
MYANHDPIGLNFVHVMKLFYLFSLRLFNNTVSIVEVIQNRIRREDHHKW